jgi:hypothetical protein
MNGSGLLKTSNRRAKSAEGNRFVGSWLQEIRDNRNNTIISHICSDVKGIDKIGCISGKFIEACSLTSSPLIPLSEFGEGTGSVARRG